MQCERQLQLSLQLSATKSRYILAGQTHDVRFVKTSPARVAFCRFHKLLCAQRSGC